MRQPTLRLLSIALLATAPCLRAQDVFIESVRPVLARHCSTCHNEKMLSTGLNFDSFRDESLAKRSPEVWPRVLERLVAGTMPPPALPRLTEGELKSITGWIRASFPIPPPAAASPSSRVTIRRLNRAEYNNTIRDLLGVVAAPASDFPMDDSGYGFDNIADVLSLSPMLMEKYMASARKLSRLAVYGEPLPSQPSTPEGTVRGH